MNMSRFYFPQWRCLICQWNTCCNEAISINRSINLIIDYFNNRCSPTALYCCVHSAPSPQYILYLFVQNPSDSELEDRITKIIAEEDEEIIRRTCYNYRLPATRAAALPPPSRPTIARVRTNSSCTVEREASDIDDDELHQLLGVDWFGEMLGFYVTVEIFSRSDYVSTMQYIHDKCVHGAACFTYLSYEW